MDWNDSYEYRCRVHGDGAEQIMLNRLENLAQEAYKLVAPELADSRWKQKTFLTKFLKLIKQPPTSGDHR